MKYLNQLFQVVEDGFVTCLYEKPSVIFCNTSFQNILHLDGPRLGASRSVMLPTPELGESACTQANLADNGFFRNWVAGIVFGFVNLIKSEALLNFYTPQGTGYSEVIIIQTSSHPLSTPGDAFVQDPNCFRVCCACSSAHEPLGTCLQLLIRDPPSSISDEKFESLWL